MASRDEMTLWTRYFDSGLTRAQGRRVPKSASIPKPSLDSIVWAARSAGIRKMRQEPDARHPSRPHSKEGRVILPPKHATEAVGVNSKEGVMKAIGTLLRSRMEQSKDGDQTNKYSGSAKGNRRRQAQRKSFKQRGAGKRRSKFGKK
tara:strand:- start:480 stop:920 length:441 start_codon:yes stop_codon:yes gene_type:complete